MGNRIKAGIIGYGNLGRGVEKALKLNPDFELIAVFTRRNPDLVKTHSKLIHISDVWNYKDKVDVMLLCGGSAEDLPVQGPEIAAGFNTVDGFDNHKKVAEYLESMDDAGKKSGRLSLVSAGWDPGLFSLNRLLAQAVLPQGKEYTFWGAGVSQGHSDAIKRVKGVKRGIQYTIPVNSAIEEVRSGDMSDLKTNERHERVCYIVLEEGADAKKAEDDIKSMPGYFADYRTTVNVISEQEFVTEHNKMPHGGFVISIGDTGNSTMQRMEFGLTLENNPEFTACVLVAYARAVHRLSGEGKSGACTVFDIPFSYLLPKTTKQLIKELL